MTWVEIGTITVSVTGIIGIIVAAQRHNNTGRSRIYGRMDEVKTSLENKIENDHVRKDICVLRHEQVDKKLSEIEKQTALIPGIAVTLKTLVSRNNG